MLNRYFAWRLARIPLILLVVCLFMGYISRDDEYLLGWFSGGALVCAVWAVYYIILGFFLKRPEDDGAGLSEPSSKWEEIWKDFRAILIGIAIAAIVLVYIGFLQSL